MTPTNLSNPPAASAPKPRASKPEGMPLALTAIGQDVTLVEVEGDRHLQLRLAEMGLVPGARFRILNKGRSGPFIVMVKDTRLILGNGMVRRIRVATI